MSNESYEQRVNTTERESVEVRPVVASMAREIEASFARHDDDPRRAGAWSGHETAHDFLFTLRNAAESAYESYFPLSSPEWEREHPTDRSHCRRALVRAGAWIAIALMILDAEDPQRGGE